MNNGNTPVLDQLADLLAEGVSVIDAAKRLGIDKQYANALVQRMRRRLGPQAV